MEEFVSLETLEYESSDLIPELILLLGLMLRNPKDFVMPLASSSEYRQIEREKRNVWLQELVPNLIRGKRELFYSEFHISNLLLPDVCVKCMTSFPLTIGGRLRVSCPYCGTYDRREDVIDYIQLMCEVGTFFVPNILFESLVSQLIYKYYSPNGDKTWQLLIPKTLD